MKKTLSGFFALMMVCSYAFANMYVLYEISTGSVVDISDWDDAVIEEGQAKLEIADTDIVQEAKYYDIKNGKLSFNAKRFNDAQIAEQKVKEESEKVSAENKLIENKMKKQAYDALKAEGVKFEKILDTDFASEGGK
jgi:predicted metal-dependent hydrolase